MQWDRTVTTIYFDGQFWVAVIEHHRGAESVAARHVFGPEPNNAELLAWAGERWQRLHFDGETALAPHDPRRRREDRRTGKV